jgi:hypothetical protein
VRTGFLPHLRREIAKALKPLHVDRCPFTDLPNSKSDRWGRCVRPTKCVRDAVGEAEALGADTVRGVDGGGAAAACGVSGSAL